MPRFAIGNLKQYAQAKGLSLVKARELAREDLVPGAKKVNGRWYVPLTNAELSRGGSKKRLNTITGARRDSIEVEMHMPSNLDGNGALPNSAYRKTKSGDPSRPYSYQGIIIVRFKGSGDIQKLPLPSVRSSSKASRADILAAIHSVIQKKYNGSPFDILRIEVIAREYQPPKKLLKRPAPKAAPAKPLKKLKRGTSSSKPAKKKLRR